MSNAAIYIRVSTGEQAKSGLSLREQRATLTKLAEHEGLDAVMYEEAGKSGEKLDRPELQRLLRDVDAGKVSRVLVIDWSRLSRDDRVSAEIGHRLERAGVLVQTPAGVFDPSQPESAFAADVLRAAAKFDQRLRTKKSRATRHRAAAEGFWPSGPPPFGYKIVPSGKHKQLEPDAREAKAVRRMFALGAKGYSPQRIVERLDAEGLHPRRAKRHNHMTVRRLMRYETYATGRLKWGPVAIEVTPLVSERLFRSVQRLLDTASTGPGATRRVPGRYLLAGRIFCERCGRKFYGKSASGGKLHYYWCASQLLAHVPPDEKCSTRKLRADRIDAAVWDAVVALLQDPGALEAAIARAIPFATEDKAKEIAVLEEKLSKLRERGDRIAERLYDAVDTERNERLLRKLQDDERGTKAELSRLRVAAAMRDGGWEYALRVTKTAGKLRGQIARASFFQKWRFIDTLNVRVVVPEDPAQPLALELAVPSRPGERDGERINLPDMPDWHVRVLDELALPVGLVDGDTGSFQTIFDKVVGMFS